MGVARKKTQRRATCRFSVAFVSCLSLLVLPVRAQTSFTDVTAAAGLTYSHHAPVSGDPMFCSEMVRMAAGVCVGDFDEDGWADLFITRLNEANLLYLNQQNGTFAEVGVSAGVDLVAFSSGCAVADINNDGHLDIYVLTFDERNYCFLNDGTGSFVESAVALGVDSPGNTTGSPPNKRTSAAFGDYDLDGDLDLAVAEWSLNGQNSLLQNNNGIFSDVTSSAQLNTSSTHGFAVSFADVTKDGWPELLFVGDFGSSMLLRNQRNGTFVDATSSANVGTDENGMGSAIGDVDNDGDLDWFVTAIFDPANTCGTVPCNWGNSGNRLFINDGTGVFTDGTDAAGVRDGFWGWGASFLDFDNDGDLDLVMTNGVDFPCMPVDDMWNADPVRLWENDGTGQMNEVSGSLGLIDTSAGKGVVCFDFDNDGDLDIFFANNNSAPKLFENVGGNQNNWLNVRLIGNETNRFGVGAVVTVQAVSGGSVQTREMSANSNFMSQNEIVAHFGLGAGVTSVYSVQVQWPRSQRVKTYFGVAPNQVLVLTEPVGTPIPTTSTWGLVSLCLLLASAATIILRPTFSPYSPLRSLA